MVLQNVRKQLPSTQTKPGVSPDTVKLVDKSELQWD